MIADLARLVTWEWYKIRLRWMPWILLAVAILIAQLGFWFAYGSYHNESLQAFTSGESAAWGTVQEVDGKDVSIDVTCVDLQNGDLPPEIDRLPEDTRQWILEDLEQFRAEACGGTSPREDIREAFAIPGAITGTVKGTLGIAPFLIMILAGSAMGAEYAWGTLRTTLTGGPSRRQLLSSKLVLLVLAVVAGLLAVSVVAVVASLVAAVIPPSEEGGFASFGKWSDAGITFIKAVYALAPYIALGTFLAVVMQSSSISISISLGYYVVEQIVTPLLKLNDSLAKITDYILGGSVGNWMDSVFVTVEVSGEGPAIDQPDALQAFLVILAYTVVLGAASYWIFQRRDVGGAKGG